MILPVTPAHELAELQEDRRWLVESLWADQGVGIVGGEPKCCKSILALDVAVAVASGMPCLRRFSVPQSGRVLLFNGEDALHVVRQRLDDIAAGVGASLDALDVHVITSPALRLDLEQDQRALAETVEKYKPRLLVLDPLIRLHRIDENAVAEVAPLLAFLRDLQRRHQVAVVLVHHFRKGASRVRQGQALRGSSELHAWGDSNLYLRRSGEQLTLSVEHRAAPSIEPLPLRLKEDPVVLETTEPPASVAETAESRILQALKASETPIAAERLRGICRVRRSDFWQALANLVRAGRVVKNGSGYLPA